LSANLPVSRQSPLCYEVFSNNTLLIIDFLCQKDLLLETHKLEVMLLCVFGFIRNRNIVLLLVVQAAYRLHMQRSGEHVHRCCLY